MPDRPTAGTLEQRAVTDAATPTMEGRRLRGVVPYGVESRDLGGWREVMDPGCLRGARLDDLVATVDHAGVPIGRHPRTLEVEDTPSELRWSVELPESRADVREAVERGDLHAGSWRMVVAEDRWDGDVRHVVRVAELRDVSVVTNPAYAEARAEYRSAPPHPPASAPAATPSNPNPPTTQEATVPDTPPAGGGLTVEDRAATPDPTIEERVLDAVRSVARGESRSLSTTSAAAIAPDELSNFLFDRLRPASVGLRAGIRVIATDRDSIEFPKLSTDVTPGWVNEGQAITPSDPTLVTLTATPRKLAELTQLSNEVIDDSDPSIVEVLTGHVGTAPGPAP